MQLKALSHIQHDHQEYNAGDALPDMPDQQAQQLVDSGAAAPFVMVVDAQSEGPVDSSEVPKGTLAEYKGKRGSK